jgi:hypothetical protein
MSRTYYVVTSVCCFLVPFVTLIGLAVLPDSAGGGHITVPELVTAVVAMVLTGSAGALPATVGPAAPATPEEVADA